MQNTQTVANETLTKPKQKKIRLSAEINSKNIPEGFEEYFPFQSVFPQRGRSWQKATQKFTVCPSVQDGKEVEGRWRIYTQNWDETSYVFATTVSANDYSEARSKAWDEIRSGACD